MQKIEGCQSGNARRASDPSQTQLMGLIEKESESLARKLEAFKVLIGQERRDQYAQFLLGEDLSEEERCCVLMMMSDEGLQLVMRSGLPVNPVKIAASKIFDERRRARRKHKVTL